MGFYYRKFVNLGPFRVTVSRSGEGLTVRTKGFRTGVSPKGRRSTNFSLPGTGLGYRTEHKGYKRFNNLMGKRLGIVSVKVRQICSSLFLRNPADLEV